MELNNASDKDTFVIQNITLNYHVVSDIGLQFAPRQVIDLTWEDETMIKRSRNLQESLRSGILRRLTKAEYEKTMELQTIKEKKELERHRKKTQYEKVELDGDREVFAETLEINDKIRRNGRKDSEIGDFNTTMMHVQAYSIAQNLHSERGETLTPEEFATMVEKNPKLVQQLVSKTKIAQSDTREKRHAYIATPNGDNTAVARKEMINYNRDFAQEDQSLDYKESILYDALDLEPEAMRRADSIDVDFNDYESEVGFAEEIDVQIDDKDIDGEEIIMDLENL
jgi:hypothetical protein